VSDFELLYFIMSYTKLKKQHKITATSLLYIAVIYSILTAALIRTTLFFFNRSILFLFDFDCMLCLKINTITITIIFSHIYFYTLIPLIFFAVLSMGGFPVGPVFGYHCKIRFYLHNWEKSWIRTSSNLANHLWYRI